MTSIICTHCGAHNPLTASQCFECKRPLPKSSPLGVTQVKPEAQKQGKTSVPPRGTAIGTKSIETPPGPKVTGDLWVNVDISTPQGRVNLDGAEVEVCAADGTRVIHNTNPLGLATFLRLAVGLCEVQVRWKGGRETKRITIESHPFNRLRFHAEEW